MDVEKVLIELDKIAATLAEAKDPELWRKVLAVIDVYPFPELTPRQRWKRDRIRDQVIGRIEALSPPRPPPRPPPEQR